uniref:Calcium uniporter protein n=1 Tax=Strigamia maritima TaxID=126957 RepID=T1IW70_STRMM
MSRLRAEVGIAKNDDKSRVRTSANIVAAEHAPTSATMFADVHQIEVTISFKRGLPVITVPLPSRREKCRFTLRPVSHTVGDFLKEVRNEDKGIDRIGLHTTDGVRIASSSSIESLVQDDFQLVVNDVVYHVTPPTMDRLTHEELERLSDVRKLVYALFEALHVDEHQLGKERELHSQLEALKVELEPLEKKKLELAEQANRRTNLLSWLGLGLMASQFGVLARLTWWEYSWDIMEPVTYFVTYGTTMAAFAYYVLTKQEYILTDVKDREYLISFHKRAKKIGLDVHRYNELKDAIAKVERDLSRLRDPLFLHLPQLSGTKNEPSDEPTNKLTSKPAS